MRKVKVALAQIKMHRDFEKNVGHCLEVTKKAADKDELLVAGIDLHDIGRAKKVRPFMGLRWLRHYRMISGST
jgi:predicted amidohydrolase